MDNVVMRAADIDDLQYRIHCAAEVVLAVHTSFTQGETVPDQKSYDALFGAYCLLQTLDKEMREKSDALWDSVCKEKTVSREGKA